MNSRQRTLAALNHEQPDRVPVDLGATPSSGISAIAYGALTRHLGLADSKTRIYDVVQQLAQPEEELLDRLGVDVVDVGRTFNTKSSDWYDIKLVDGTPAQYPVWFHPQVQEDGSWRAYCADGTHIATMPASGYFFDQACFPYLDGYPDDYADLPSAMRKVLWAGLAHSPWDHAGDESFWQTLRRRASELRASSERAIVIACGCNLLEWGMFLRRMDNFLMDLHRQPDQVERLLDALMEQHLATLEKVCTAVGDVVDILRFGDDLGMDSGPFMRPALYRRLFKPRHTQLCDYVRRHSSMKTFLHSCGSIYAILPDLIEAGYDVINPVQTNCHDMEPERLKREFGNDITFWGGGCDTRAVLNHATPGQVREHVLQRLEIFAPGGGYVFNPVHNILPEVPPENVLAAFDAVAEFNGV
jgi:uroporphyrinogen decarboxylase